MANIRINDLPSEASPSASDVVAIDGAATRKATLAAIVGAGLPLASQAEAEAGTDATKAMTPLTTAQAIAAIGANQFATVVQGATADSALQPGAINVTVQAHSDLLDSVATQAIVTGDILYGSGTGTLSRLAAGTNGQVIRLAGGVPSWTTASGLGDLLAANNLSDVDDTDEVLDNLGFGDAGKDISALSIAADVRNYLDVAPYVATRTALKALDTTKDTVVRLTEAGREGVFKWTTGNFSTHIAADTQEGIYVKADAVASTVGAWVRVTPNKEWLSEWFAIPADDGAGTGSVLCDTAWNAMVALGNIVKPSKVTLYGQIYSLGAAPAKPLWICEWAGSRGAATTILIKHYIELGNRGIFDANDFGGHVHDIAFQAGAGYSGGSLFSSILTGGVPAVGRLTVDRCRFSGGDSVNDSVFIDGRTNVSVGGPGNRGIRMSDCEVFGAASNSLNIISCQHSQFTGLYLAAGSGSGGTGPVALKISGLVAAPSDDLFFGGTIAGNIDLDRLTRTEIHAGTITNVANTSDVASTRIYGSRLSGTLEHDWDNATCEYVCGIPYMDNANVRMGTATQADITGDGTKAVILWDTIDATSSGATMGWTGGLVYNAANGRFTAKRGGWHWICARPTLAGLTSSHTQCDLYIETFASGGGATGVSKIKRFNPWAMAVSGLLGIEMSALVYLDPGQYVTVSVTVTGGTKVVDVTHVGGMSQADFRLH